MSNFLAAGFLFFVQLNLHETDLLFRYLSHDLTWHCYSIYENLHRYEQIFFAVVACHKLFRNNNKNNFSLIFVQICANI